VKYNPNQHGGSLSLLSIRLLKFTYKENSVTLWINNFYLKKTIKCALRVKRKNIIIYKSEWIVDMKNGYVLYRTVGVSQVYWQKWVTRLFYSTSSCNRKRVVERERTEKRSASVASSKSIIVAIVVGGWDLRLTVPA